MSVLETEEENVLEHSDVIVKALTPPIGQDLQECGQCVSAVLVHNRLHLPDGVRIVCKQ